MKNLYTYIISTGAYSSYDVECLAVNEKRFSQEELKELMGMVVKAYKAKGYPTQQYKVKGDKVREIMMRLLRRNGFQIVYPIGEFHYDDYSCMDDIKAYVPYLRGIRPSALRIGLA